MRVRVVLSEAWRSLMANVSTTVAATMTVLIGMFLLGLFVALGTWTLSWSDHAKRQLMVKAYFVGRLPLGKRPDHHQRRLTSEQVQHGRIPRQPAQCRVDELDPRDRVRGRRGRVADRRRAARRARR